MKDIKIQNAFELSMFLIVKEDEIFQFLRNLEGKMGLHDYNDIKP